MNINNIQSYFLVDTNGKFFLTLEQNAIASRSKYESDGHLWSNLVKRTWKDFPVLKVFEEGYDKDYIYEKGRNIPFLKLNEEKEQPFDLKSNGSTYAKETKKHIADLVLLTMRGAIKFNMWKRMEGGKMITSALIEHDDLMLNSIKKEIEDERKEKVPSGGYQID